MKHKCVLAHTFIFGVFTGNMPPFEMYGSMYRTHTNLRFIHIYGFSAIFHFRSGYPSTSAWKPRHTWATFHNHLSSIELPLQNNCTFHPMWCLTPFQSCWWSSSKLTVNVLRRPSQAKARAYSKAFWCVSLLTECVWKIQTAHYSA